MNPTDLANDLKALAPHRISEAGPTRRIALAATLGVGYAAAALPVMAQTAIKSHPKG